MEAAGSWYEAAETTYPSLIDVSHRVSALYNLVNVPSAIWVDESGHIVRIDSGAYVKRRSFAGVEVGTDRYVPALRDWIEKGANSAYALVPEALSAELSARTGDEALAEQNFKLGSYFFVQGDKDRADRYWDEAKRLSPENWNYHRQDWSFSGWESTANFLFKVLGTVVRGQDYYAPISFPDETP